MIGLFGFVGSRILVMAEARLEWKVVNLNGACVLAAREREREREDGELNHKLFSALQIKQKNRGFYYLDQSV